MKKLSLILMMLFTLVGCGKDNSSGGDDPNTGVTINGMDATQRYNLMASTNQEEKVLYDNLNVFALELLKDRTFILFKETRRGFLRSLISGTWSVSGTNIVLPRVGTGSYMESSENGILHDCIYFMPENLSTLVKDQYAMAGIPENRMLKFCKRR